MNHLFGEDKFAAKEVLFAKQYITEFGSRDSCPKLRLKEILYILLSTRYLCRKGIDKADKV